MRVTRFTDLGFRALFLLAEYRPGILSAAAIADQLGVSRHHMAKVVQALARAGYVEAIRGAHGGVRLARGPENIGIGDLVRALETQLLLDCLGSPGGNCALSPRCCLKQMFATGQKAFLQELDHFTLSDCLEECAL